MSLKQKIRKTFREYSRDFEFGIFQSIGFKEFEDYMKFVDENDPESTIDYESKKQELFTKALNEMKATTRRYAKTQIKWVRNRFIKRKL